MSTASAASASTPGAASPAPQPDYLARGTPALRRAQWALFAAGFSTFSLLYCVQPLMPLFTQAFGVSPAESSLVLSLCTGLLAIAIFLVGLFSQALPRKRIMALSLLASAILGTAAAIAPDWHSLLALRALQGVAMGGVPAVAMAYLAEEVEPDTLGFAMGLYISGSAFGGLSGRVITGLVSDHFGWRAALGTLGLLGVVAAVLFIWLLPASRRFTPRRPRGWAGVAGDVRAGIGAHLRNGPLCGLFAMGGLLMGAFVTVYNYVGFRLLAPPFSLSQTFIGFIFVVYLVGIFASTYFGRLADRHGRGAMLAAATGLALAGLLLTLSDALPLLIAGIVVFTFGFFAAHAVASGWVGQMSRGYKALAASLYLLVYYVGSSVLGSLGGHFWTDGRWPGVAAMAGGLLALALLISAALYWRTARLPQAPAVGGSAS
ncbi:MFS transporter [Achromobacter xylosoxidans]|uniref:MFS transporter n=1 Tax=Alcaligenes xylosoxydans xylosoxydans TaxID=85698 RepID=UPI000332297C|nr:MFS transporter [Achromobacter xylosoxidans]MCH4595496.1 MFS transporter [Achromobacter xylosoxidans]MCZ8440182.1 MFS transporter [Achromobacter xylosoxidans]WOB76712.1 MFS transporter [Achromobacter xylosoxidans]CCH08564.1 Permeases of the major facilitator superfamily [Achromobacter xylosoxidans NH44784-1996]CUI40329.1 Inner membrane transport protein ynfM [Achromobacter xylosoxidans]